MKRIPAVLLLLSALVLSAPAQSAALSPGAGCERWPLVLSAPAQDVAPVLELRKGENYFRAAGVPRLVVGRNPTAMNPAAFAEHFKNMAAAGETFARIHFCHMPRDEKPGEISAGMLKSWDATLDAAEKYHIAVMPVFGVWSYWNDGTKGEAWHLWNTNPFNAANGGSAKSPAELFEPGTCRALWMKRLEALVKHWQPRRNIVAWEIFSELDLLTGSSEAKGTAFAVEAAKIIRDADPSHRPVTCSMSGVREWPQLFKSDALDFVEVHPYGDAGRGDLDELILKSVRERLATYHKPVMIGECGLDWRPPRGTLDTSDRGPVGIRHAIWAAMMSGAMNARALWWQDGYDQFEKADLCSHYQKIATPAGQFVKDIDCAGLAPVNCTMSPGIFGAMLGSATNSAGQGRTIIGWFRDAKCVAPKWAMEPVKDQWAELPAREGRWLVEFGDVESGKILESKEVVTRDEKLRVALPEFCGSVAVRGVLQADGL